MNTRPFDRLTGCLAMLLLGALVFGCAPSRSVWIPEEWQKAPPPARQPQAPAPRAEPAGRPVFKEPRQIEERSIEQRQQAATDSQATAQDPQFLASMHLVEQGNSELFQGRPDPAIELFEQAVQVDVYNGEAFLGLARAWRVKGNLNRSLEFARKAEMLLQDEPKRLKEVLLLQASIYDALDDSQQASRCRSRASRL